MKAIGSVLGRFVSSGVQDKYRTRVEVSAQTGALEVYISHRAMEEMPVTEVGGNVSRSTRWEHRPANPELEAEMLQRLLVRLGSDEKTTQKMFAETATPVSERAKLGNAADGGLQLTVNDPLERAWRQVGLALDRIGVVVEDRDRAKGAYFVRYIVGDDAGGKKDEGWFSGLFSSKKSDSSTNQFRVEVTADAQQTVVRLLTKDGAAAPAASAKQILNLLYNELK
jgi:outer membrane protein assembly factor BamC